MDKSGHGAGRPLVFLLVFRPRTGRFPIFSMPLSEFTITEITEYTYFSP